MSWRGCSLPILVACLLAATAGSTAADEIGPPRDVDAWHAALAEAVGGPIVEPEDRGWSLGLYPGAAVVLGPPEWIAYQLQGFVSLSDGRSFSLFTGYGYERGPDYQSHQVTLGWGGVRRLHAARPQRGFYGKFLRYRRTEDFEHGLHQGLSVGTESCAGIFALAFELGAARSESNHWSLTAQIGIKIAVPIAIPLSADRSGEPGS